MEKNFVVKFEGFEFNVDVSQYDTESTIEVFYSGKTPEAQQKLNDDDFMESLENHVQAKLNAGTL
jgi:hypothetical protein